MKRRRFSARAVLFDWDGTIVNSYGADSRAYLAMFEVLGVKWGLSDLARHYSPNWYRVYRAARLPRSKWDEADRIWTLVYNRENPRLMPGARQIIRALKREFVLGVVTSGNRPRVRKQLREFALARLFFHVHLLRRRAQEKAAPRSLESGARAIGLAPEECIYVGDTAEDIEMSRRAGVRPIGVLGPFPTAARVRAARPDAILNSIRELPHYLQRIEESAG